MLNRPESLDALLAVDVDDAEDDDYGPPQVLRVRSKSVVSPLQSKGEPPSSSEGFNISCCLYTPRDSKKRRSLSISIHSRRQLDAKLQQSTQTTISVDLRTIVILLLCCMSTACAFTVPAATRPVFPARLDPGPSRRPFGRAPTLHVAATALSLAPTQHSPALQLAGFALDRLAAAVGEATLPRRAGVARAILRQRYQTAHSLSAQPLAAGRSLAAPLDALSASVCAAMFPVSYRAVCAWHEERAWAVAAELSVTEARLLRAITSELGGAGDVGGFAGGAGSGAGSGSPVAVSSRVKSALSIFEKAVLRRKAVSDLLGIRVVLDARGDAGDDACYAVASLVQRLWPDSTVRVKDYIAQPKPNGYQSLHVLVSPRLGVEIEVQIRTAEMHARAERGSAAHALYKAEAERIDPVLAIA